MLVAASDRKRVALTVVVVGAFVFMLAGTSKAPVEGEAKEGPEAKEASKAVVHDLEVPATDGWKEVQLPSAGIVVSVPPDATVDPAGAGNDAEFSGRYFRVKLGNGLEAYFAQNTGQPTDFAEKKRWYEHDAIGFEGWVFEAADALIVARKEAGDSGEYWETTACSAPIEGKPLCAESVGATIEDGKVTKATHEENFAVVAIARSIRESK